MFASHCNTVYLNYWEYKKTVYISWKLIFQNVYTDFYWCSMCKPLVTWHIQTIIQFFPNATKRSFVDSYHCFIYLTLQIIHFPGKGRHVHQTFHIPQEDAWHIPTLPERWVRCYRQINSVFLRGPPRYPDFKLCDSFLLGCVKGLWCTYLPFLEK